MPCRSTLLYVLTEWKQFKELTPDDFIQFMATPVVIDARRIFDPHEFGNRLTFLAVGVGDDLRSAARL